MSSSWGLEIATARGDRTVMPLTDATGLTFDRYIGKVGSMSCTVKVANSAVADRIRPIIRDDAALTLTGYIHRDRDIWWGGRLGDPAITLNRDGATISVTGTTFEGYLDDRTQATDITYTGIDQLLIARSIWNTALAAEGNLGITVPTVTSGVLRDLAVAKTDTRTLGSMISEIADRDGGFEWLINCYLDGDTRRRDLVLGYPAINRGSSRPFEFPGDILEFGREASTARTGTRFWSLGGAPADVGGVAQPAIASPISRADDLLNNGALLIDRVASYSDVTEQATINDKTVQAAKLHGKPLPITTAKVRLENVSPAILGTSPRLRISHPIYPAGPHGAPGYDQPGRVIGIKVSPPERGQAATAELIFEEPA